MSDARQPEPIATGFNSPEGPASIIHVRFSPYRSADSPPGHVIAPSMPSSIPVRAVVTVTSDSAARDRSV
jgi:hypothetical protein